MNLSADVPLWSLLSLSASSDRYETDHSHASAGGQITALSVWPRAGHDVGEDTDDQDDPRYRRSITGYLERNPIPPE